ncbi:MAG: M20/M25/M40 family metallo-hydrolase, partial [Brevundimonas sp.]|uniref:M20/M25/M40 family metallo-hydrolase n=1 Tax=Brevundimonas sp. TaxID=1871086 RepID=UPI002736E6C5
MLFRSLAAAAALLVAVPAVAQDVDLRAQVAAFVQPSNAARADVVVAQLRAAGFEPTVETFVGGNRQTGETEGRNVVVTLGEGPREILLTAHYDAVKLRDGTMSHGVVDNAASVVAVIEAAKILRGTALNHRVRIILFDQEELGLIGARKWIEAHGLAEVAAFVQPTNAARTDVVVAQLRAAGF